MQGLLEGTADGVALDHGVEEQHVGVLGPVEDAPRVAHFVNGAADGDEVGEDLVGLVEAVAEEVGVDFGELFAGFVAVEEAEYSPFDLATRLAHGCSLLRHDKVLERGMVGRVLAET